MSSQAASTASCTLPGAAVDAIVVSPEDVERYRDNHYLVIGPALLEGKVVYESS